MKLPEKAPTQWIDALKRAGYDPTDERRLGIGLVAYQAAQMVYLDRVAVAGSAAGGPKTGRNQPCPCGSGKKFKRCCLSREGARKSSTPRSPAEDVALIPILHNLERLNEDLERLASLFQTVPSLDEIRFDRVKIANFIAAEISDLEGAEDANQRIDALAQRYFDEVEAGKLPKGTSGRLLLVARHETQTADLRALALGLFLCAATETNAGDSGGVSSAGPNPLVVVLFRLSIQKAVRADQTVQGVIDRLGGEEAVRRGIETDDQEVQRQIGDLAERLDPEERDQVEAYFEETMERIKKSIRDNKFPVPLPLVSVLPLMAEVDRILPDEPSPEDVKEDLTRAVLAACEGLSDEDLRLYAWSLQEWLDSAPEDASNEASMVAVVLSLVKAGSLAPLDWPLMTTAVQKDQTTALPGEGELVAELKDDDILAPAALERYAEFLDTQGYPGLAQRTRQLGTDCSCQSG